MARKILILVAASAAILAATGCETTGTRPITIPPPPAVDYGPEA